MPFSCLIEGRWMDCMCMPLVRLPLLLPFFHLVTRVGLWSWLSFSFRLLSICPNSKLYDVMLIVLYSR